MIDRYAMRATEPEDCEGECEWDTFTEATGLCDAPMAFVILDRSDLDAEGKPFHWAHLCAEHGPRGFALAVSGDA